MDQNKFSLSSGGNSEANTNYGQALLVQGSGWTIAEFSRPVEEEVEDFTRADYEDAPDRVSARGKYRDVPLSSEDFIAQKREEAELEDGGL